MAKDLEMRFSAAMKKGEKADKLAQANMKREKEQSKQVHPNVKRTTSDGYMPRQSNVDAARKLKGDKGFAKVVKGGYNNPGIKALRKDLGKDIAKAKQRTAQ
jgi:hypothetical protein